MRGQTNTYYVPPYNVLGFEGRRGILSSFILVLWTTEHGRKRGKEFSLFIGRFRSNNDAKCVRVVRRNHKMDMDDKAGLIQFSIGLKPSKKRDILKVFPADEGWQTLVEMWPHFLNIQRIKKTPPATEKCQPGSVLTAAARRTQAWAVAQPRGTRTATLGPGVAAGRPPWALCDVANHDAILS